MASPSQQDPDLNKTISFPFKMKADRVQQIASQVLSSLFGFPKKRKFFKENQAEGKGEHLSPTEKLNQLIAVNNLFCQLLESEDIFGFTADKSGIILDLSEGIEKILGYSTSELMGNNCENFVYPEDLLRVRIILGPEWEEKKGKAVQIRARAKSGQWIWMRAVILPGQVLGGGEYFILGTKIDK
ncbi:MAG TPA: PAS domain-containing protein [Chlamydiales bacterium]|nr:PAS domain-containing protein [Chlamydiales bacterium]